MKREELKEKISECILYEFPFTSFENAMDSIMTLIDEYTKPNTKKKSLEERREDFAQRLRGVVNNSDMSFIADFMEYWTEHNEGGKKMRFEMSKNQPFNIKRRLATWKRNQKTYNNGTTTTKTTGDNLNDWINS